MIKRPVFKATSCQPPSFYTRRVIRRLLSTTAAASLFVLAGCSDPGIANSQAQSSSIAHQSTGEAGSAEEAGAKQQTYASVWGPKIGSQIPQLAANDHKGQPQSLDSLRGDKGLLLVFSRSADW